MKTARSLYREILNKSTLKGEELIIECMEAYHAQFTSQECYVEVKEAIEAFKWALDNMKPDRPELQSDVFNILTNAMVGLERLSIPETQKPVSEETPVYLEVPKGDCLTSRDTVKHIRDWAKKLVAITGIIKGGALYQDKSTQEGLKNSIDTYNIFIAKCNRMLGIEPLLEEEWIRQYVTHDNKLSASERLSARTKHEEYLKTFKITQL